MECLEILIFSQLIELNNQMIYKNYKKKINLKIKNQLFVIFDSKMLAKIFLGYTVALFL